MNLKILLFAIVALFSVSCFAGWTGAGTIEGSYVDARTSFGRILFRHSVQRSGDNCSANGNYYELKMDSDFSREAYSLLLSAEARKIPVILLIEGCGATGYPLVTIISTITD